MPAVRAGRNPATCGVTRQIQASSPSASTTYIKDICGFYGTYMKGRKGEALLIDTGASMDLCGKNWSNRVTKRSSMAGFDEPEEVRRDRPQSCQGVGGVAAEMATHDVILQIAFEDGSLGKFQALKIPNSDLHTTMGCQC